MTSAREAAFHLINRLLPGLSPRREAPASFFPEGEPGEVERRLASELGHGVIRHLTRLDWLIEHFTGRKKSRITPAALTTLRLGVYQLVFTPSVPAYAAVSESVELAGKVAPKAKGFVNWSLRRIVPDARGAPQSNLFPDHRRWLATFYSFPLWMVRRWVQRFGPDEAEQLLSSLNTYPPLDLRANRLRSNPQALQEELSGLDLHVTPGTYSKLALHLSSPRRITTLAAFQEGRIYIQDESSQLAAAALDPCPGDVILDACAGAGGKATQLAELSGDAAEIAAVDTNPDRLARLRENTARLGLNSILPSQRDILDPDLFAGRLFSRILLDTPCSGLGVIRRHPEIKWTKRASDPARLARFQFRLLTRVATLLAPGGTLAYSTCTTEPEENQEVVHRFLRNRPEYEIVMPREGAIRHLNELLTPEGFLQTLPHRHGTDGAFVALLKKH